MTLFYPLLYQYFFILISHKIMRISSFILFSLEKQLIYSSILNIQHLTTTTTINVNIFYFLVLLEYFNCIACLILVNTFPEYIKHCYRIFIFTITKYRTGFISMTNVVLLFYYSNTFLVCLIHYILSEFYFFLLFSFFSSIMYSHIYIYETIRLFVLNYLFFLLNFYFIYDDIILLLLSHTLVVSTMSFIPTNRRNKSYTILFFSAPSISSIFSCMKNKIHFLAYLNPILLNKFSHLTGYHSYFKTMTTFFKFYFVFIGKAIDIFKYFKYSASGVMLIYFIFWFF
uniref:NADH dehydrogenase subunit 2 n=1 Tax=Heterorhabditis bacteriophora TaxID=37862 RepID=A0A1I7WM95_HETBA